MAAYFAHLRGDTEEQKVGLVPLVTGIWASGRADWNQRSGSIHALTVRLHPFSAGFQPFDWHHLSLPCVPGCNLVLW